MNTYDTKYIIGEILDSDTQQRNKDWAYRIGRECFIVLLQEEKCMILEYPNGGVVRTSVVKEIEQTDYGFWVKTLNRNYRLDIKEFYK